jgi:hypothetical protein
MAAVQEMAQPMDKAAQKRVLEVVGADAKSQVAFDRIQKYQQTTARAEAQMEDIVPPASSPKNK